MAPARGGGGVYWLQNYLGQRNVCGISVDVVQMCQSSACDTQIILSC